MMGPKGKKQRKSKRRGFRERIVLFLVWLLFFQICTPTFLPSQKFGTDLQVTCEITHLDEALPASSIVRPVPVTIGQGILIRNSHQSAIFSFLHTVSYTSCSTLFSSVAEMRREISSVFLYSQKNPPLRI